MDGVRYFWKRAGFTLVELLVSMTVIAIVLVVLSQITNALRTTISQTTSQLEEFRSARNGFETMTRRIGQATLNAYDDLDPTASTIAGSSYVRASELRFHSDSATTLFSGTTGALSNLHHPTHAIFFQAPLGVSSASNATAYASLNRLLNTCGYYIEWNSDVNQRPSFLASVTPAIPLRYRFRLMELVEPSDTLSIYTYTSGIKVGATPPQTQSWTYTGLDWFQIPLSTANPPVHVVAENVILLALLPMVSPKDAQKPLGGAQDGTSTDLTANYSYDSALTGHVPDIRNKLPPMVYMMMIAVDEKSFRRYLASQADSTAYPTTLDLDNVLTDATYATRIADIAKVTGDLTKFHIGYRVFTASVPLTPN